MERKRTLKSAMHWFIVKRTLMLVAFAIAIMLIIYQFEVNHYVNRFIESRTANFEEVLANNQMTLKSYAEMHSHWDDLIIAIESHDEEWIDENVSTHLRDADLYKVDFVYIRDEKTGYEELAGIDEGGKEELLISCSYFKGLRDFDEDIYLIGGELYLVNGSYLSSENGIENRGFFFIGRKIDLAFLTDMQSIMNTDMIKGIALKQEGGGIQYPKLFSTQVSFSVPITRDNVKQVWYLRFDYALDFLTEFYYVGEIVMILFVLYFALTLSVEIIRAMGGYREKLLTFEEKVKRMAKGKYGMRFTEVGIEELDSLISSMNQLSDSLKTYRENVDRDQIEMIKLLIKAVDINDHYTKGHSERVAKQAKELATLIGYPNPQKIEIAGLLHDVGKISVPTHILNKPGRLTEEEFEVIKGHTERGYELLRESEVFSEIRDSVHFHHERVDGKGYPYGLVCDHIPIEAMIISICDVYDALVTDRPYRKAMSHEQAMKIIEKENGKAFTEELVETFHILFKESQAVKEPNAASSDEQRYSKLAFTEGNA